LLVRSDSQSRCAGALGRNASTPLGGWPEARGHCLLRLHAYSTVTSAGSRGRFGFGLNPPTYPESAGIARNRAHLGRRDGRPNRGLKLLGGSSQCRLPLDMSMGTVEGQAAHVPRWHRHG
jgi:hypothetical protein